MGGTVGSPQVLKELSLFNISSPYYFMSVSLVGKFYQQVKDFKAKIINILQSFGKDDEVIKLNKYYDKLMMAKEANVRLPIEALYQYGITEYAEQILLRDEAFFLGKVKQIENTEGSQGLPDVVNLAQQDVFFVSHVRHIWQDLDPVVRKNIWDYVQIICVLTEKVTGGEILSKTRDELRQSGKLKDC